MLDNWEKKMNESIFFNSRKLTHKELIHSCDSRNGMITIRMTNKKPIC